MHTSCCWCGQQPYSGRDYGTASLGKEQCRFPLLASANCSSLRYEELCFYSLTKGSEGCYNSACSLQGDIWRCRGSGDHSQSLGSMVCFCELYIPLNLPHFAEYCCPVWHPGDSSDIQFDRQICDLEIGDSPGVQALESGRVKSNVMDKVSSKLYPKDNPDDASSRAAPDHPVLPHIMAAGS